MLFSTQLAPQHALDNHLLCLVKKLVKGKLGIVFGKQIWKNIQWIMQSIHSHCLELMLIQKTLQQKQKSYKYLQLRCFDHHMLQNTFWGKRKTCKVIVTQLTLPVQILQSGEQLMIWIISCLCNHFPKQIRKRACKGPYGTDIIESNLFHSWDLLLLLLTQLQEIKKLLECEPGKAIPRRLCKMKGWNPWVETDFQNQHTVLLSLEDYAPMSNIFHKCAHIVVSFFSLPIT